MGSKNRKLNLDKDTLFDLYVNKQYTSNEVAEVLGCSTKSVRNYLASFGIPIRQLSEAVKLERSKWSSEKECARSRKFIETWSAKDESTKRDINNRKTVAFHSEDSVRKQVASRIANGTGRESKAETEFYNKLCLFIPSDDIVRHYMDNDNYPFDCDFYIKSKKLFIEYQGHQTHGCAPYDASNSEHRAYSERLKKSGYSTQVFENRDPVKLETAIINKINLLLIYPRNDSYLVTDGKMYNIGKFNVAKINELC